MRKVLEEKGNTATFKCPICGSKVLVNTSYCMKCKKKVKNPNAKVGDKAKDKAKPKAKKKENILTVNNAVLIKQESGNIILEKGDRFKVITENTIDDSTARGIYAQLMRTSEFRRDNRFTSFEAFESNLYSMDSQTINDMVDTLEDLGEDEWARDIRSLNLDGTSLEDFDYGFRR